MLNEIYDEKITNILFSLYYTLFIVLLFIFNPIAHSFCDNINIPYDLTLTVNSIGFGNELVILLSIVSIILFHYLIKLIIAIIY